MSDQIIRCPSCGGRLVDESLGWKCTKCKGFVDMQGKFHAHVERPFMPPMTNADRIRSMSDKELAELLTKTYIEGEYAMMIKVHGHSPSQVAKQAAIYHCAPVVFEWLKKSVKEDDNGKI